MRDECLTKWLPYKSGRLLNIIVRDHGAFYWHTADIRVTGARQYVNETVLGVNLRIISKEKLLLSDHA